MGSHFSKVFHIKPFHPTDPKEVRDCPVFQSIMRAVRIRRAIKKGYAQG